MEIIRVLSAVTIAVAVNGMHYTGMAATSFHFSAGTAISVSSRYLTVNQNIAMVAALAAFILFLWMMFILSLNDLRSWYYSLARVIRESDLRAEEYVNDPALDQQSFLMEYQALRLTMTQGAHNGVHNNQTNENSSCGNSDTSIMIDSFDLLFVCFDFWINNLSKVSFKFLVYSLFASSSVFVIFQDDVVYKLTQLITGRKSIFQACWSVCLPLNFFVPIASKNRIKQLDYWCDKDNTEEVIITKMTDTNIILHDDIQSPNSFQDARMRSS